MNDHFKYLLYTGSDDLSFNTRYKFSPAMSVDIDFYQGASNVFDKVFNAVKEAINTSVRDNVFSSEEDIAEIIAKLQIKS